MTERGVPCSCRALLIGAASVLLCGAVAVAIGVLAG